MFEDSEIIGSMPQGFAAGFCCGIIGLVLVLVMAKGGETKKGAIIGFVTALILGVAMNCLFIGLSAVAG